MSLIPLRFKNWWDDLNDADHSFHPFRSSCLTDQNFGHGLHRNDLLSAKSVFRNGYLRPWVNEELQNLDSGSTVKMDKDKFEVGFAKDVINVFTPYKYACSNDCPQARCLLN